MRRRKARSRAENPGAAEAAPTPTAVCAPQPPGVFAVWLAFVKIGAVLFGGGYAMLGLLEREVVEKRKWIDSREMQNYFALAQLLPGVIAVNAAMLVGNRLLGLRGNLAAAAGVTTVPFLCIAAYAAAYDSVKTVPAVAAAMAGMRPAVAGMMAGFGLAMVRKAGKSRPALALAFGVCAVSLAFDPPLTAILGAGVAAGVAWALFVRRKGRRGA